MCVCVYECAWSKVNNNSKTQRVLRAHVLQRQNERKKCNDKTMCTQVIFETT